MSSERARLAAVRALYVEWSCSRNPVLLAAAGQLRQAAEFSLTPAEIERARQAQGGACFRSSC